MIQDLLELALLMERKRTAFAGDKSFDLDAAIKMARTLSQELEEGTSRERLRDDQLAAKDLRDRAYTALHALITEIAKDLRDRAYTALHALITEIREAGRYAYAEEPKQRQLFASEYRRRKARRRKARAGGPAPDAGETPAL